MKNPGTTVQCAGVFFSYIRWGPFTVNKGAFALFLSKNSYMHYRTLTIIVTILLIALVVGLMAVPTANFFMLASALVPVFLGILVFGVLRSPAGSDARECRSESDWYDR